MARSYFTQALREEMNQRDVSQVDIAHGLEVSEQYISDVLLVRRGPLKIAHIMKLVEKFGMDGKKLLVAKAWTVKQVEIPPFVKYEQVEEVVCALMERKG